MLSRNRNFVLVAKGGLDISKKKVYKYRVGGKERKRKIYPLGKESQEKKTGKCPNLRRLRLLIDEVSDRGTGAKGIEGSKSKGRPWTQKLKVCRHWEITNIDAPHAD